MTRFSRCLGLPPAIAVLLLGLSLRAAVPRAAAETAAPGYQQTQTLFGAPFRDQHLGLALAAQDDLIVAGAPWAGPNEAEHDGLVYTFTRRDDSQWYYLGTMLRPPGWLRGGEFGRALALDGDTLAVAARLPGEEPDYDLYDLGAIIIYTGEDGQWQPQWVLVPPALAQYRGFGERLALQGDTLVVVASAWDRRDTAYIYHRTGDNWSPQAQISLPDDTPYGLISAAAVHGDVLLLGDEAYSSDPAADNRGQVFVYKRQDGVWTAAGVLQPDDGEKDDNFGCAIDFDGVTALIAACALGRTNVRDRAYLFRTDGQDWTQTARLDPTLGDEVFDLTSVAYDDDRVILGAPERFYSFLPPFAGAVFVFERRGEEWQQTNVLRPGAWVAAGDVTWAGNFAAAAAAAGDDVVVASPTQPLFNMAEQGLLYVYAPRPAGGGLVYAPVTARQELAQRTGLVVYQSFGNGGASDLYLITPDGRGRTQLTDTPVHEFHAAWSPDGKRLVFVRDGAGGRRLVIRDLASGDETILPTPGVSSQGNPNWSRDGRRIVFDNLRGYRREIFVVNVDGTGLRNLTETLDRDEHAPVWSPDGTQIAYIGEGELSVMNADGSQPHTLGFFNSQADRPAWSPDGAFILYSRTTGTNYGMRDDILIVTADTGALRGTIRHARDGRWSADGTRVVFAGESGGIFHRDVSGIDLFVVVDSPFGGMPDWQP